MTDFILSAADQATMYAGYQAVGITDAEGNIRTQGLLPDGTEWFMLDHGPRFLPSGKTIQGPMGEQPEMVSDGFYYCVLRWNGGAPMPPVPPGVEIFWSSASEEPYPVGITQIG